MRHAERLVKHVRLRPRSSSECRSDDVVKHRVATRSPSLRRTIPPLVIRIPKCCVWKIFTVNYSYFTWFWRTGIAAYFAFCFVASLVQSYITCRILFLKYLCMWVMNLKNKNRAIKSVIHSAILQCADKKQEVKWGFY